MLGLEPCEGFLSGVALAGPCPHRRIEGDCPGEGQKSPFIHFHPLAIVSHQRQQLVLAAASTGRDHRVGEKRSELQAHRLLLSSLKHYYLLGSTPFWKLESEFLRSSPLLVRYELRTQSSSIFWHITPKILGISKVSGMLTN